VIKASPTTPTVRGTIVTGSKSKLVNEARTLRLTKSGLCEARNRVVAAVGDGVDVYETKMRTLVTQNEEQTCLLVPTFANGVKGTLDPLNLFIQIFVHMRFEHFIAGRAQQVSMHIYLEK
jgi:hypothetical protein